jgi:hypothetical protein
MMRKLGNSASKPVAALAADGLSSFVRLLLMARTRQPANEQRGAVQTEVEADAVVFDNERTNPIRADDFAGPDEDPEGTICNGDGALTVDV